MTDPSIEMRNIEKRYGSNAAVRGVDLATESG